MNKITPLETKCLANMPVVLDAIATTIDTLSEILNPQYDRIEECLTEFFDKHKRLKFDFENGREFQSKYIFTDRFTQYKKGALRDLTTVLELYYCIPFGKNVRNGVSFSVQFGYTVDETQNEVYFGLGEMNSAQYLTDEWIEKIKTESAGDWEIYTEDGYIEFQDRKSRAIPTMLDYRTHIKKGSMFNTPPCLPIYSALQTLKYYKEMGGIKEMEKRDLEKAAILYDAIDSSKIFVGTAAHEDRSIMNVCFVMKEEYKDLESEFIEFASSQGMVGIKGHRSVGGFRASIYNAMPKSSVEALVATMKEFEKKH